MSSIGMVAPAPVRPKGRRSAASPSKPRRYELSETFFKDAVDKAVLDSLLSPVSFEEHHDIKFKPKFDTACWTYLPPHRIYIGLDLFEKEQVKLELSDELKSKYIQNHFHHELAHALYTIRDLNKPKAALQAMGASFSLWNLFEDAYIEERYRRESGYRFEWLTMETADFSRRPESLLFGLIQAEGDIARVRSNLDTWLYDPARAGGQPDGPVAIDASGMRFEPTVKDALNYWLPKVEEFYQRTIAVTGSMQLMPIIKAWIDEFGLPPAPPPGGPGSGGEGTSDLELAQQLASDPESLQQFEQDCKPWADKGKSGKAPEELNPSEDKLVSSEGRVLSEPDGLLDERRVAALVARFKKFFATVSRRVSTRTPQRRVSARHFAVGRSPYRKEVNQGRGKKSVLIVVDCSGSMSGSHIEEGWLLVAALSDLASLGCVEGHVVFTGVDGHPIHETYALPLQRKTILSAQANYGAEGLEAAIRSNISLAKAADYVFVYTDAQITDNVIDKTALHAQGVFTWGLYAGYDERYLANMLKYFDKAILRASAEDLVDAMLAQNA